MSPSTVPPLCSLTRTARMAGRPYGAGGIGVTVGTDSALDAAADCHVLRNDAALDLCALVDLEIRGAHFAFDSAEDLCWTIAFDLADDRHVGADARGRSRFCRGL